MTGRLSPCSQDKAPDGNQRILASVYPPGSGVCNYCIAPFLNTLTKDTKIRRCVECNDGAPVPLLARQGAGR